MLMDEIRILQSVCHPHIIRLYDIYETRETVFLVTDYCRGGELFDRLVEKVHYAELDARHIARQLFDAVAYLHNHGIIHRDIKPENILLRTRHEPSDIAISDFGLSRFIPGDGLLLTACGSPQYVAPEVLLGAGYGPEVDIWSAGVVTYCLLAGYTPFYADDQPGLFRQIVAMNFEFEPEYWSGISETAKDFICKCLCKSSRRMTASEALHHPWLRDLPPLTSSIDQRGCLLQDCKARHAKARQVPKAGVSASDIVEYVRNLCTLRSQHPDLASSAGIEKLKSMADLICRHQHGDALNESEQRKLDDFVTEAKQRVADHDARVPDEPPGDLDQQGHGDEHREGEATQEGDNVPPAARVFSAPGEPATQKDIGVKDSFAPSPGHSTATEQTLAISPASEDDRQVKRQRQSSSPGPVSGVSSGRSPNDLTVMMVLIPPHTLPNCPPTTSLRAEALAPIASESENDVTRNSGPIGERRMRTSGSQRSQAADKSPKMNNRTLQSWTQRTNRMGPASPGLSEDTARELNGILEQYNKPDLPKAARVDPTAPPRTPKPWTMKTVWALGQAAGALTSAVGRHIFKGPLKESWGIEMTLFTRLLREGNRLSDLVTIDLLQNFFDLAAILPIAQDGLVTPVTIKVRKLGLRGFLADADAAETGERTLSAEWVSTTQTWRRLQTEHRRRQSKSRIEGQRSAPPTPDKERIIYYIHGGAYFVMSPATHRTFTIPISRYTDCRIFAIDYRLAPGAVFPGQLHDVVVGYFRLVRDLKIPPKNIVLGSDSAGGGLALALMMYLRDNDYPLPGGAILFSPWVDLTMSCRSWDDNADFDYLPRVEAGHHLDPVRAYLGDKMERYITHPYASPLFGDLHGLPPLLIQTGDAEVLRDENILLAHKCQQHGVKRRFELYKDCVHVFPAFLFLDASKQALLSARHFVRTALDPPVAGNRSRVRTPDARTQGDAHQPTPGSSKSPNDMSSRRSQPTGPAQDVPSPSTVTDDAAQLEAAANAGAVGDSDNEEADDEEEDHEQWELESIGGRPAPAGDEVEEAPSRNKAATPQVERPVGASAAEGSLRLDGTAHEKHLPSDAGPAATHESLSESEQTEAAGADSAQPLPSSRVLKLPQLPATPRKRMARSMPASPLRTTVTNPLEDEERGTSAPLPRPHGGSWTRTSDTKLHARLRSGSDAGTNESHLVQLRAMMEGAEGQAAYWSPSTRSDGGDA